MREAMAALVGITAGPVKCRASDDWPASCGKPASGSGTNRARLALIIKGMGYTPKMPPGGAESLILIINQESLCFRNTAN